MTGRDAKAGARIPRIGIAGEIGAGKSTVARLFEEAGCVVHDADAEVRRVLATADVVRAAKERWGAGAVRVEGGREVVDRAAIAAVVFDSPSERAWLEGLVHPPVREARARLIQRCAGLPAASRPRAIVLDVPLLFEAGVDAECDRTVFVTAPRAVRLHRVSGGRGWTDQQLAAREKAQMPAAQKRARSTDVIENAGSIDDLRPRVEAILNAAAAESAPTGRRGI